MEVNSPNRVPSNSCEENDNSTAGSESGKGDATSGYVETDIQNEEESSPNTQNSSFKIPILPGSAPSPSTKTPIETSEGDISLTPGENQGGEKTQESKKINKTSPSPAEGIQSSSIQYKEPPWGGITDKKFNFEVLKNGMIIDNVDLTQQSYFVFGRLPSCDITMEHPSLSRYHAVVQYCSDPTESFEKGWYLYDLDSTHGTWINKNRVSPNRYHRIRVGHVIKFGGSTRLNILQVCLFGASRITRLCLALES